MAAFFLAVFVYSVIIFGFIGAHLLRLHRVKRYAPTDEFAVAVIVPCKGRDDAHFEDNLVRMINQQYAGPVQFVFSVESDVDPALPVLQSLARQFENVWVCVAGLATQCSQKVFNILQGMACITDIDIFLIADADIQPHHTWLQEMVAPFSDPDIGAVTGYYRRLPLKPHFQLGDYLLGLSNACLTITMSDNRYRSLWGGSMAIRESIMDKHNLYQWLSTEIVDDMALMQALRQYRIKRHYTPSCTVKSYCDMSLHNSIEWQVRQFQYLQIYAKYGLYLIVVATFPYIFLILAIPFIFIYGLINQNWLAVVGGTGFWFLIMAQSWLLRLGIPVNPDGVAPTDQEYRLIPWLLVSPVFVVSRGWILLKTMLRVKRGLLTMDWRGVKYRVKIKTGQVVEIIR
jgi:cellulose synthase/poly-beta-1,6-N-acetylglucosamine synthase-like glycosyltransferase